MLAGPTGLRAPRAASPAWATPRRPVSARAFAGMGLVLAATPILAEPLHFSASARVTETYTTNVDYTAQGQAKSDFFTEISAGLNISGETGGKRLKINGSIGLGQALYIGRPQNNNIVPNVNVAARLEAIENFAFVDARAVIVPTFSSPFAAQPANIANATQNRYTQQAYSVSPSIRGVFGSNNNLSYQVRDDNLWTVASGFGDTSTAVPNTYVNQFNASLSSPTQPVGWTLDYARSYYDNGLRSASGLGQGGTFTTQSVSLAVPYRIDPQIQISAKAGAESNQYPLTSSRNLTYGVGGQWSPTDRTQVSGNLDHRFFGAGYSAQISHRLPNVALSASLSRGLSSFPALAFSLPAGASINQYLDLALATRIPDPIERAIAVQQFLARTGLPATLGSPLNYYTASSTLQRSAAMTAVLIGGTNSVSLSLFNVQSEAISDPGAALPPALRFAQNNTQTGGTVAYSRSFFGRVSLGASASYSRASGKASEANAGNQRSNNSNVSVNLGTPLGAKTNGTASLSYSRSDVSGTTIGAGNTSAVNASVSVNHTF